MTVLWLNNTTKTTNIMNTIFLLCQCDSLVTTVCGNSIPVVITKTYEAGTNVQDLVQNTTITLLICIATVIVALIVMCTLLLWKYEEIKAKEEERKFQMTKDKDEAQRKQKADLLDKYLDFLKEQINEKDYISIEKYEEQRKSFMKELLQIIQDEKLNCLKTSSPKTKGQSDSKSMIFYVQNGANNELQFKLNDEKSMGEDKSELEQKKGSKSSESDNKKEAGDNGSSMKEKSINDLITMLTKYIDAEKTKPATIDQNKIDRYRKTLEYLIRLSQQDKLNEFSEEELETLINNEKKEQKGTVA